MLYKIINKTLMYLFRIFKKIKQKKKSKTGVIKLHLGCGSVYLEDYINIDSSNQSFADIVADYKSISKLFPEDSVTEILLVHSISYLRYWEAIDFFKNCYSMLKTNGKLILEFPDIEKCASSIVMNKGNIANYMEAVRAFYAFDLEQIRKKELFKTYMFGWSAWHVEDELVKIGFTNISSTEGFLHNYHWRDTRVEATK